MKVTEKERSKAIKHKGRDREEIRIGRNKDFKEEDKTDKDKRTKNERNKGR